MENISSFSPVKRKTKCALSVNEKIIIINVYNALKFQNHLNSVESLVEMTSNMTGIGKSTIYRLLREKKCGSLKEPKPAPGRPSVIVDELAKNEIRKKVHAFYFNKEIPTLDKVLANIRSDENVPEMGRDKLWRILREMNFRWEKQSRKSLLIERTEIVCWRRNYLRSIRKFRSESRKLYYLDETWLNEGYTVGKIWQDKNITSSRQAFIEGLSTGLKTPSGKGRRLIITHIGSSDGFVKGGLLKFQSKRTVDYHEEMTADVFEEYFQQMLDLIPPGSVIVMDNASYHSRKCEKSPTSSWKKADVIRWLLEKEIKFEGNMVKKELLAIAQEHKDRFVKYVIDEMAKERNVTVLRLPPYHCELNPIELIWAQVKGYVARRNTTFKMNDVQVLFEKALSEIDGEKWSKCIEHVIKIEERMWDLDHCIDDTIEPLIINVEHDESFSDLSFSDNDEF
jgi:transposase